MSESSAMCESYTVLVRRPQLVAALQCGFVASGMSDEEALLAARDKVEAMIVHGPEVAAKGI